MRFGASAPNLTQQKREFRSAEGLCSKEPDSIQRKQPDLVSGMLFQQAHRVTLKKRGKDVCSFAQQSERTYIKKEKFRSAEGLCLKKPEIHANKSTEFGIRYKYLNEFGIIHKESFQFSQLY